MDSDEQDSSCGCSTFIGVAASVSTAVKRDNNTCPSSSSGTLPASPKNTLSQDKPRPPLLGESPTKLGFGSLSRQGWFDLQSTGSSWGWDRIPGSEGGQTRAFLDGDQAGDEAVSNTPLAGLRFYYPRQRVRKHSTEEQTANPSKSYTPPRKQSPRHYRERGEGKGERPRHPTLSSAAAEPQVPRVGRGRCGPAFRVEKRLLLTPPQPAPPRESAPDPAAMLGRD